LPNNQRQHRTLRIRNDLQNGLQTVGLFAERKGLKPEPELAGSPPVDRGPLARVTSGISLDDGMKGGGAQSLTLMTQEGRRVSEKGDKSPMSKGDKSPMSKGDKSPLPTFPTGLSHMMQKHREKGEASPLAVSLSSPLAASPVQGAMASPMALIPEKNPMAPILEEKSTALLPTTTPAAWARMSARAPPALSLDGKEAFSLDRHVSFSLDGKEASSLDGKVSAFLLDEQAEGGAHYPTGPSQMLHLGEKSPPPSLHIGQDAPTVGRT